MTIRRTEFEVSVKGADATAKAFDSVATAEARMVGAAGLSSAALERQERAQEKARESARKLQAEIAAVAMPANGMKVAVEGAGKALTVLSRAAAILPGFGIAGLLLAIGEGASYLAEQFAGAKKSTELQDAALREYARTVEATTRAVYELGRAQAAAGRSAIGGALGIDPRALSGQARIEAARLGQLRDALDADQKRLDAEYGQLAARERSIIERGAKLSDAAQRGVQAGMFGMAAELERDAAAVGATRRKLDAEVRELQAREVEYARTLERLRGLAGQGGAPRGSAPRTGAAPTPPTAEQMAQSFGLPAMPGQMTEQDARDARAEREEAQRRAGALDRMSWMSLLAEGRMGPAPEAQPPSLLAMLTADDDERAQFEADMEAVSAGTRRIYDATREAADGARQLGQSMGLGLSNAAAAALLTGGSFKKLANDVLKSVAVQAAGLAIFETAKGLGNLALAAFGVPNAAAAASLNFQSAAMYGAVAAIAGAGAGATGGLRSGGSARAMSAGVAPSMGGTSQYGGGSGGATVVQVYISGEQVTRAVRVEQSRQRLSGGITGRAA